MFSIDELEENGWVPFFDGDYWKLKNGSEKFSLSEVLKLEIAYEQLKVSREIAELTKRQLNKYDI